MTPPRNRPTLPLPIKLIELIRDGSLLAPAIFAHIDCDSVLDARDGDTATEREWLLAHDDLKSKWLATGPNPLDAATLDELRRVSFLAVSAATNQHELASYVSDDFELIGWASLLDAASPFVDSLWAAYSAGKVAQAGWTSP
jgi:hypothetical protein